LNWPKLWNRFGPRICPTLSETV